MQTAALTGTGVFLNPLGVVNAASFAPPGNPISPGEFVTLFGTGLAKSNQTAAPPYPPTLNGVSVLINNKPAPLYFVSPGQLNVLVPFATTGPTATIVVQNGSVNSNTVTVPVAATSPGIYSLDQSGSGAGAILHADYSLVNAAKPAAGGETVLIYLTGMGTVTPPVADGTAGTGSALHTSDANVVVYVAASRRRSRSSRGWPRISRPVPAQRDPAAAPESVRQPAAGHPDAKRLSRSGGHPDSSRRASDSSFVRPRFDDGFSLPPPAILHRRWCIPHGSRRHEFAIRQSPPCSFLQPGGRGLEARSSQRGQMREINWPDSFLEFFFGTRRYAPS